MEALLHDRGNLLAPTWHWKFEARLALKTYISFGTDFSGPMGLGSLRRLWHKSDGSAFWGLLGIGNLLGFDTNLTGEMF